MLVSLKLLNKNRPKKYVAISAFALVILTISFFVYHSQGINYTNQIVTEKGERRSLYLPDSTLVVLNSLSEIHYPNAFKKTRDVFVNGEVFFDVTHNEEKPFIVHTTNLDVQVLGTAFNVNTSTSNKIVSLERGKVNVLFKDSNNQLTLSPNEQLIYNNTTNDITKKNFNAIEVLGWKDEMLILDKTPFIEAIKKLNQFYGVTFRLKDKTLESKKITGAFKGLDIKGVISSLEFIANITIVPIHKNEYLIIGNDAN
ncbi:FecR family protein [Formosa algae]|uniref:FecR family protein n=1 Tax=Formosa algae TaxID=225843 RepID=UPI00293741EB|nr:FecR domain-containing protein [Formosa algae]